MKVIHPQTLPKKNTTIDSAEEFTRGTNIPTADPEDLALAGVTADTFQPRYEALYRKWVTGPYDFRFNTEFGRTMYSWIRNPSLTPLTIAVIADNPEYVKQLKMSPSKAMKWFDKACIAGSAQVATYLQETYQFDWNDDDFLFAKVGASSNIDWLTTLAHQFKLLTLPDNTFKYVNSRAEFSQLLELKTSLKVISNNCQPS